MLRRARAPYIIGTQVCVRCGFVQRSMWPVNAGVWKFQCAACDEMESEMSGPAFLAPADLEAPRRAEDIVLELYEHDASRVRARQIS